MLIKHDEGNSGKRADLTISDEKESQKRSKMTISDFPTMLTWNVYEAIRVNREAKYTWLVDNIGVSEASI